MNRPDTSDIKTQLSGLVDKAVGTVQEQAGKLLDDKEMEARGAHKAQDGDAKLHGLASPGDAAQQAARPADAPKATPSTSKRARNGKTRRASRR